MPELCKKCKKEALLIVGFDETKIYKKCVMCQNSIEEPRVRRT